MEKILSWECKMKHTTVIFEHYSALPSSVLNIADRKYTLMDIFYLSTYLPGGKILFYSFQIIYTYKIKYNFSIGKRRDQISSHLNSE